jgi:prepilin-type N-terminal cleavage/methylation domain-containing protein
MVGVTLQGKLKNQKGFTLIELLIVIGILAILLAITLIALNPAQHFQNARNAQRQSDVVAILDSIYEYQSANKGTLPPSLSGLTTTATAISNAGINLCADVIPTYIADLPSDPSTGTRTPPGTVPCTAATAYSSGYMIAKSATGSRIIISAPAAENGATISVTR